MVKYSTPPPHTEKQAAEIRRLNKLRNDEECKHKVEVRREIEARREARRLGLDYNEIGE